MNKLIPAMLGPNYFDGEGGAGGTGEQSGTSSPQAPPSADDGGVMIPKARFDEVNREYQKLVKSQEEKARSDAEAKGEFEKLASAEREKADKERAGRESAEAKAMGFARRAGFVSAASGKVADPQAAYKLAMADGMLDGIEVNDEGDVDAEKVAKIVEKLVEKYPFITGGQKATAFGGPANGLTGSPPIDPSKMSAQQKIAEGLRQAGVKV